MAEMEKNLLRAEKKMEKSEKKQGGILGALTSKWAIVGATVAGVGYAMIKASPSLSYAMEEVQYRFEDMLALLGEQFAPLIEEILIPALDQIMPLIEEFAPMIGKMVGMVLKAIEPLTPIFERVIDIIGGVLGDLFSRLDDPAMKATLDSFINAFGRIATAVLDIAEEVLPILFGVLEALQPMFTGMLLLAVEGFAGALGAISTAISVVIGWIKDNDRLMSWFEKIEAFLTGDLAVAIDTIGDYLEDFWGYIEDVIEWMAKDGGLFDWLGKIAGFLIGRFALALTEIFDKIETFIGWVTDARDILHEFADAVKGVPGSGGGGFLGGLLHGAISSFVPGFQTGTAYVPQAGIYALHGGEQVSPPHSSSFGGGGGMSMGNVIIQIDSVTLSQDMDVYDFADKLSRRFKEDVERAWY